MRTRKLFCLVFLLTTVPGIFSAESDLPHRWGIGVMLGEPTGISVKNWQSATSAFAGGVAWSFRRKAAFHLHGDFLIHRDRELKAYEGRFMWYYGTGLRLKFEEESRFGARFPLGLDYIFPQNKIELFLEFVPILELLPATDFLVNGAVGIRYLF